MSKTIDELLEEFSDQPVTKEQITADIARTRKIVAEKHGILESEVDELIREHRYTHSGEDVEEDYMEAMSFGRAAGLV